MGDVTYLDRTRDPADVAHDEGRFKRLALTPNNILDKMAEAASDMAGWGAGNEAAIMRFAMVEIINLRAAQAGGKG